MSTPIEVDSPSGAGGAGGSAVPPAKAKKDASPLEARKAPNRLIIDDAVNDDNSIGTLYSASVPHRV